MMNEFVIYDVAEIVAEVLDIDEIEDRSYEAYHKYGVVKGEHRPATWDSPAEYPWVEGYEEYIDEMWDVVKKALESAGIELCDDDVDYVIKYLEDGCDIMTRKVFEEKVFDDFAYENEAARISWEDARY